MVKYKHQKTTTKIIIEEQSKYCKTLNYFKISEKVTQDPHHLIFLNFKII